MKRRSVGVVNGLENWALKIGWRKKSAEICVVICANQRETHQHFKPFQSSGVISRRFRRFVPQIFADKSVLQKCMLFRPC